MIDTNFFWLFPQELAGGPWPNHLLNALYDQGIKVIINLTETSYDDERFTIHQIPVENFGAPSVENVMRFCLLVQEHRKAGQPVYVHCLAGCGRTGTMLACYLMYRHKISAIEAISHIRRVRPCAIETEVQEDAVVEWQVLLREEHFQLKRPE